MVVKQVWGVARARLRAARQLRVGGARQGVLWGCDAGAVARRAPVGAWQVRLGVMRARLRAARRLVRDG